jgi:2-keto-4-pentenoate hydratase/2-oxohepta-3-ene-1,7-dioic acid hydratase in catechol pathway
MRWVTYADASGHDRTGVVEDGAIHALDDGVTLLDLLDFPGGLSAAGDRALAAPREIIALDEATLRAPLQPRSIRDHVGFLQHIRNCFGGGEAAIESGYSRVPTFYFSNTAAVTGPHDDVAISPGSMQFDYELEVAAVIGRRGFNIPRGEAEDSIAGYMILCDWSARDLQLKEMAMGLGPAKGKDGANTLGPALVTPDELESSRSKKGFDLSMTAYVNGELVSSGRWDSIDWDFADMITYASRGTWLRPGDVIGSGTVPTGCLLEHYAMSPDSFRGWLQPGDEVRLEVERLGILTHRVVAGAAPEPLSTGH